MTLALGALASLSSIAAAQGFGQVGEPWASGAYAQQSRAQQVAYTQGIAGAEMPNGNLNAYGMGGAMQCSHCDGYSCDCGGCECGGYDCGGYDCGGYDCGECQGDCYGYGCEGTQYCGDCTSPCGAGAGMFYAEIQNTFLRTHVSDQVVGKLREKYEWSPRAVIGYETPSGLGARGRYWNYTRTTTTVDGTDAIRLDWDVIDVEGTNRFSTRHGDIIVGGGFRWADLKIADGDEDEVDTEMPGITFAIDGRSVLCRGRHAEIAGVVGARWSILGGDWEGDNDIIQETFDDNVTSREIYGGFELVCRKGNCDLYTRVVFEMQNWHSDALGENSATDSISLVGPAIHGGITF